eukprot:582019-Pyramimonas_sp.AAC.1
MKASITNSQIQIMRSTKDLISQSETKLRQEIKESVSAAVDPVELADSSDANSFAARVADREFRLCMRQADAPDASESVSAITSPVAPYSPS